MPSKSFAIIAHFDPDGRKSANWVVLLDCISEVCASGVVVSTGICDVDAFAARARGFRVIRRDNIGYDFLSYAIGMSASKDAGPSANRLICNDSLYVADRGSFTRTLAQVLTLSEDVVFLTKSNQIATHGQSFCFAIKSGVFNRAAFQDFFKLVRPLPTKMEIILSYELGLARMLQDLGIRWSAVIEPDELTCFGGVQARSELNPTQHFADEIIRQYGFAKIERLISNPNNLENSELVDQHAERFKSSLNNANANNSVRRPKAVAIVHCYYLEVVDELIDALDNLIDGCEIYVSSSNSEVLTKFKMNWRRKGIPLHIISIENWGRDVRPFIYVLQQLRIADDVPILKIHGKRSLYSPNGDSWRRSLLKSLLPPDTKNILGIFQSDPKLAMLGSPNSFVSNNEYWGANRETVHTLLQKEGHKLRDDDLGFFAGTMFWIRSQCAKRAFSNIDVNSFEHENGQRDGTLGHALERSVSMLLRAEGWHHMETDAMDELSPLKTVARRVAYY
ncbi:rhamnan synthesis F family protein [Ochrobactrum teleogrylli]|uniref:rhamnan synthesis F family protein n=1 Tax=Ochrobactrum teleogrylli TaxID=2479765 RepID=UPI00384D7424